MARASLETLEDEIGTLAAHLNAGTYRLLALIAELDRREPWAMLVCASCAHYLNWKCGIALGAAREKVRSARALRYLVLIREAFRLGRISDSKVRALTRVATRQNEADLLEIALHGTATHVERIVRDYRAIKAAGSPQVLLERRAFESYWDDEGMLVIRGRLTAEQGAVLLKALEQARELPPAGGDTGVDSATDTGAARRRVPLSGLHPDALRRCASHPPLGPRRGHEPGQSGAALSAPPHRSARGGYRIAVTEESATAPGRLEFIDPYGLTIQSQPPGRLRGNVHSLIEANQAQGLAITAATAQCRWDGKAPDYDHIMLMLFQHQREPPPTASRSHAQGPPAHCGRARHCDVAVSRSGPCQDGPGALMAAKLLDNE